MCGGRPDPHYRVTETWDQEPFWNLHNDWDRFRRPEYRRLTEETPTMCSRKDRKRRDDMEDDIDPWTERGGWIFAVPLPLRLLFRRAREET